MDLFASQSQPPLSPSAITQLTQLLQGIQRHSQAQDAPVQPPNMGLLQVPQSSGQGASALSNIAGTVGGWLGGSGTSGGWNSLDQGLGFASNPTGTYGPFNNPSLTQSALSLLRSWF